MVDTETDEMLMFTKFHIFLNRSCQFFMKNQENTPATFLANNNIKNVADKPISNY